MRWIALGIDYEMYGKDLIPTFQLSAKICRALGGNPPENFFYELFLDQNGEKISKSKGNGLSIEEWLTYAPQETLSYFMYQNPRRAKKLFLEVIPKSTDEFISHLNKFDDQSLDQKIENPFWHISNGSNSIGKMGISYNLILNLVSASGSNDPKLILDFIKKYVGNIEEGSLEFLLKLIDGVINYYNDVTKSSISYKKPSEEEVLIFEDLIKRLSAMPNTLTAEEIQTEIYQIGKDHNFTNLRDWFSLIYQVLFGKSEGPRFGSFVAIYGIDRTIQLWESMGEIVNEKIIKDFRSYTVNQEMMSIFGNECIFMHCLPANRGQEVAPEVIDGPQSVVWDEAQNRLHIQKEIIKWCL